MAQALDIPLTRGLAEQVDAKILPNGALKRLENYRIRKDGRIGKRAGSTSLSVVDETGATLSGYAACVTSLRDQRLAGIGNTLYSRVDAGSAACWVNRGMLSPVVPESRKAIGRGLNSSQGGVSCAAANGYIAYAYYDDSGQYVIVVEDETTGEPVFVDHIAASGTPLIQLTRINGSTQYIAAVWKNGTTIQCAFFDTTDTTPTSFGAPVTITGTAVNVSGFDICEDVTNDGTLLLVYQSTATTLRICRVDFSGTVTSSVNHTVANSNHYPGIHHATERIYVSYVDAGITTLYALSYNTSLGGVVAASTIRATIGNWKTATMCRLNSTNILITWEELVAGTYYLGVRSMSSIGSMSTVRTTANFRPASRPFAVNSSWYCVALAGEDEAQQTYVTVDIAGTGAVTGSILPVCTMAESEARPLDVTDQTPCVVVELPAGGYLWCGKISARGDNAGSAQECIDAWRWRMSSEGVRHAWRQTAQMGPARYFAGGTVQVFDGDQAYELGFVQYPRIESLTAGAGGSLTVSSTYSYVVVYEWLDAAGQRHVSSPSDPLSVTLGGAQNRVTVSLTMQAASLRGNYLDVQREKIQRIVAHVYRTLAGGTIYYRVSPDTGATIAQGSGSVTYVDDMSDANADDNEVLYTMGGVLPNMPPPACRLIAAGRSRLAIGGLFKADVVQVSKVHVPGEPVLWSDSVAFQIVVPDKVTAIYGLDDTWVIWTETGIYYTSGEGPDDRGASPYPEVRRIPSDVGCIDARSLLEVPDGVIFQSKRGLYMLPRSLGSPVFIGAAVMDKLQSWPVPVGSVALVTDTESTAMISCAASDDSTNAIVLSLDLRTGQWSSDTYGCEAAALGVWDEELVFLRNDMAQSTPIRKVTDGSYGDLSSYTTSTLETGDIRPFGLQGRGLVRTVQILAEYRGAHVLTVEASYDGGKTYADSASWTVSALTAGDMFVREWALPRIQVDEVRFRISDSNASGASEGAVLNALTLMVEPRKGARRTTSAQRA